MSVRSLRRRSVPAALPVVLVAALVTAASGVTQNVDEQELLKQFGFSPQDVQKIGRGEIIGHTTQQAGGSEVALAVAGTIGVPTAHYLQRFRAI
jgi:hypothetical protein